LHVVVAVDAAASSMVMIRAVGIRGGRHDADSAQPATTGRRHFLEIGITAG
jgi:hypothetical protein